MSIVYFLSKVNHVRFLGDDVNISVNQFLQAVSFVKGDVLFIVFSLPFSC